MTPKAIQLLLGAPVLLFAMVAHEYAHGYAAHLQGDDTAKQLGRLSWNPLRHIDPFMTVIMPLMTFLAFGMAFGGARPVPVNPRNYRNYRRGDIIVSLAGVTVNFVLAVLLAALIVVLGLLGRELPVAQDTLALLQVMFRYGIVVNLVLVGFNLIPIPPLDGSHVFKHLLPPRWALGYARLSQAGFLLLLALLYLGRPLFELWMSPFFALYQVAQRLFYPFVLPSPLVS